MRKTVIYLLSAALVTGTALTSPAMARDRTHRVELTANQMADRADARTAKMKVDLNLTADQDKNWAGFASAMQDMNKKQADRRIAMRDARAQQHGGVDLIDELRRNADSQIEYANERKKLPTLPSRSTQASTSNRRTASRICCLVATVSATTVAWIERQTERRH